MFCKYRTLHHSGSSASRIGCSCRLDDISVADDCKFDQRPSV